MNHRPIPLYPCLFDELVGAALREDLGTAGDLTTDALTPVGARARARIAARQSGRVAGLAPALSAFERLDPELRVEIVADDGSDVGPGDTVAVVTGSARALLTGERTALNLLCHLSGVATATRGLVIAIGEHPARIVCTRKTTPGLRALEKYAVRIGGGANHRFGLDDAVMIKDNHLAVAGGLEPAIARVRAAVGHMVKIEVEVDTLAQLDALLAIEPLVDAVLLDNMDLPTLRRAVARVDGRMVTEASGGITPAGVASVAAAGVDLISTGWITHSAPALDLGLDFEPL